MKTFKKEKSRDIQASDECGTSLNCMKLLAFQE